MAAQTTVVFNHTVVWEGKDVKEVVEPDGTVVWSYEAYNKRLTQNACLYGICGAVIVYTLVLNHLLKDFGMDQG